MRRRLSPCACVHLCEAALERHIHREADPHHARDVTVGRSTVALSPHRRGTRRSSAPRAAHREEKAVPY